VRLIKASEIKFNPLEDGAMDEVLPAQWHGPHVGVRIADAFITLSRLPASMARSSLGFWPDYQYSWQDMLAQMEQAEEEQLREKRNANRVRLAPGRQEITRMEQSICWPMQYLGHAPQLALAVNIKAMALAFGRDEQWVGRKYAPNGGRADLCQRNNWEGCALIAEALIRDKVAVF
jgi:hypothetical protein